MTTLSWIAQTYGWSNHELARVLPYHHVLSIWWTVLPTAWGRSHGFAGVTNYGQLVYGGFWIKSAGLLSQHRLGSGGATLMIPSWSLKPIKLTASLPTLTLIIQPSNLPSRRKLITRSPVLDVQISRDDTGQLSFQVYRKPTHTEQYVSFSSHHPLQYKLGVIRTLSDRAATVISKEEDKQHELARLRRSLAICGYKDWAWDTVTRNKARNDQRLPRHNIQRSKGNVGVPYRRMYHIVTDHAFWVESIVTYHQIYRKKCIT